MRVDKNRPRTAAVIPVQDSLVRRWIRIKQAVGGLNDARFVWICHNAWPSIEQCRAVNVPPGGDVEWRPGRDVYQRTKRYIPSRIDHPAEAHTVVDIGCRRP